MIAATVPAGFIAHASESALPDPPAQHQRPDDGASSAPPAVSETHSAVIVCMGDRAYKVKKPVNLGFLDFSTLEARRQACVREVALNRRLAPDVYLGVYDLVDPAGERCEHLVVMRRMPETRSLKRLVLQGLITADELRPLARLLARFHAGAPTSAEIAEAGSIASVRGNWRDSLGQMADLTVEDGEAQLIRRIGYLADRYLAGRSPLLEERQRLGFVRDGHGDLLSADIYLLADGPRVLDCLEFDDQLRYGDVLLDIAFLAMDLEDLGRPDLAAALLTAYDMFSGHLRPRSLTRHYIAYRAMVRSKVALVRRTQGDVQAGGDARRLEHLCLRHLEEAAVRLVLVGGLPGTGKSTVAAALAEEMGCTLLRSDVVRKQSLGMSTQEHMPCLYGAGAYASEVTDRTYAEMLRRARVALSRGESVVLDASWASPRWRRAAAGVAADTSSDLMELMCRAPAEVAADRMRERARHGTDPSDADAEVASRMAAIFAPWPSAVVLDTDQPLGRTLEKARAAGPSAHGPVVLTTGSS